jgi:hypothetical protein
MTMKTMSLELWSFYAIVTVGLAVTGCAAETTGPGEEDPTEVRHSAGGAVDPVDDDSAPRRDDDVPMLRAAPGPRPGDPVARSGSRSVAPAPPDPCPGQVGRLPQGP